METIPNQNDPQKNLKVSDFFVEDNRGWLVPTNPDLAVVREFGLAFGKFLYRHRDRLLEIFHDLEKESLGWSKMLDSVRLERFAETKRYVESENWKSAAYGIVNLLPDFSLSVPYLKDSDMTELDEIAGDANRANFEYEDNTS